MPLDTTDHTSQLFTVLSHRYRRIILYYLDEHGTASIDRLSDLITGWMEAGPGGDEAGLDEDTLLLQLHHVHVPALAEAEYVAYDRDAGEVSLKELTAVAEDVLDAALRADTTETGVNPTDVIAEVESNGE